MTGLGVLLVGGAAGLLDGLIVGLLTGNWVALGLGPSMGVLVFSTLWVRR